MAPHPVFYMNARNLLNRHFDLARSLALMCKRKTVMYKDIIKARNVLAGNFQRILFNCAFNKYIQLGKLPSNMHQSSPPENQGAVFKMSSFYDSLLERYDGLVVRFRLKTRRVLELLHVKSRVEVHVSSCSCCAEDWRWSGQGRFLTGYAPCPSAARCRRTEHPLPSSDQPVKKTRLRTCREGYKRRLELHFEIFLTKRHGTRCSCSSLE
ncbi:hypothetical protein AVEN_14886-1 [Araneus ventricosus]|uniref:Uncharacterized protein n=1 Tax=Araneus ventricosus TaxID=182803 RepID=A0A4Y2F891_ARAVE|nr:hypothetical protein AVEN_14886-1 [Araneus ventricosus]